MHFLKYIELNNYLNLKHAKLKGLKDLNIIIGPNNCGKTSLLKAVNLLSRISFGRHDPFSSCSFCGSAFKEDKSMQSIKGSIEVREKYLTKTKFSAVFGYDKDEIEKVLPKFAERQNDILTTFRKTSTIRIHLAKQFEKQHLKMKEQTGRQLVAEHASPIIWNEVTAKIFGHVLFCPEERLQTYKGIDIPEHIKSKNFTMDEFDKLIKFLEEVIDPKISSIRHSLDLVRQLEERFNTPIAEQGSGVKSLVCLAADILSATQTKILLIDEPELGLNPSGKHAFLKFLSYKSKDKQIFLATHDPTFVNPVLWNNENTSVYLFSLVDDDFVKVNLMESKEDPNTFAGYLPHTTSLKQVHIYVEGSLDVYIFQIFLNKYAKKKFDNWYQIVNRLGIYHLAGDFWKHLLYTIPRRPYTSIVILDGDKKELVKQVLEKYSHIEPWRFQKIDSPDEIMEAQKQHNERSHTRPLPPLCPVYCLKRSEIEDYLEPRPSSKQKGPIFAEKMSNVPDEIERLFDAILELENLASKFEDFYFTLLSQRF
jgi:AAA15 family ATPase/GTPase